MTTGEAPLLLVVDDDPVNLELLCDLLEALDYRVAGALSGDAALAAARERRPELVLLDVMMPGMNGYEVCRRLKDDPDTAGIPVVFVTALSDVGDKVEAIEAGADDFLTKPFSRPVLVARIRSLLRLKHANDELAASYRRLREMEELKDDLTKMVVHDLKSPLAGIMGSLELVVDGDLGPLAPEQRRLLSDSQQRAADALRIIDNLLDVARMEESGLRLHLAEVSAGRLLREVESEWSVRAERQGAVLTVADVPDVRLQADPRLLRRVLANLVGNALRHAGPRVRVRLSAAVDDAPGAVRFTVEDDGAGIPDGMQDEVFRKYATAGEQASSGLGLSFCKLAVEAHGGAIWVRSHRGEGAAFHFTLPARGPAHAPA